MTDPLLIDYRTAACLCDVGAPEFLALTAVDANGDKHPWLMRKELINQPYAPCGNANQPHEQLGRLPGGWRERIWGELARCGRPTARGKPCRRMVSTPGEPCGNHRGRS